MKFDINSALVAKIQSSQNGKEVDCLIDKDHNLALVQTSLNKFLGNELGGEQRKRFTTVPAEKSKTISRSKTLADNLDLKSIFGGNVNRLKIIDFDAAARLVHRKYAKGANGGALDEMLSNSQVKGKMVELRHEYLDEKKTAAELPEAEKEKIRLKDEIRKYEQEVNRKNYKIRELVRTNNSLDNKLEAADRENGELKIELSQLEDKLTRFEHYPLQVRTLEDERATFKDIEESLKNTIAEQQSALDEYRNKKTWWESIKGVFSK